MIPAVKSAHNVEKIPKKSIAASENREVLYKLH